jgi:hypothetical protein
VVLALRVHWQQSLAARGVYMVNFQLMYCSAGGFQLVHIGTTRKLEHLKLFLYVKS